MRALQSDSCIHAPLRFAIYILRFIKISTLDSSRPVMKINAVCPVDHELIAVPYNMMPARWSLPLIPCARRLVCWRSRGGAQQNYDAQQRSPMGCAEMGGEWRAGGTSVEGRSSRGERGAETDNTDSHRTCHLILHGAFTEL